MLQPPAHYEPEPVHVQLRRRRVWSYKCPPLNCCPCRDPLGCRCHNPARINDQYVDGYQDAAQHLLTEGLPPAPNVAALRRLWRRGGQDQRLARRVAELWEVSA